jgi:hypothetical protein
MPRYVSDETDGGMTTNRHLDCWCGYCGRTARVSWEIIASQAQSLTIIGSGGPNLTWKTPDSSPNSLFDFEAQDWGFAGNSFDLIHAAQLCGAVSSWPRFLEKAKRYSAARPY